MENQELKKKKPIMVWIIFIYILLTSTWGQFNYISTVLNYVDLPEKFHPYFQQLTTLDLLLSFPVSICSLIAAIFLFRLDKRTVKLWCVTLIVGLILTIYHSFIKNWGDYQLQGYQIYGGFIALIIPLIILLYSYWISKKNILT